MLYSRWALQNLEETVKSHLTQKCLAHKEKVLLLTWSWYSLNAFLKGQENPKRKEKRRKLRTNLSYKQRQPIYETLEAFSNQ